MIDYQKELNQEQLNAVKNGDGPCLVLAGAGSGKTRTITYRVAYLIEQGVNPNNILLVTFTNKAAREMINRVAELCPSVFTPWAAPDKSGYAGQAKLPWSGTFHHIAYRILKKYAALVGYKNNFTILDSEDSLDLIKLCLKQEGIDRKARRFPSPKVLQSIISYARNAEIPIEEALELKHANWLDIVEVIKRIGSDYDARKKQANCMDFDDLLTNLHLLLRQSESARQLYSEQFKYILVDEYQDTNRVQASIVRLLASRHQNILVVGDDAQSIYSFRAADIQHILAFEKEYPNAKVFRLETNYRSTPDILNLANDVIANNTKQYQKELKSTLPNFTRPEVCAFSGNQQEAEFITKRILELSGEGVALNKMAVVFRAAFHSQALEMELVKRGIQYDYRGGIRFFERAHIKDVLAYLRIFGNKDDTVAWNRILNMQVGIGPATVEVIIERVRSVEISNASAEVLELPPRAQAGWNDFLQIYENMVKTDGTPAELIRAILESKYAEYLEYEYTDFRDRLQDIDGLALFAEKQSDLNQFLAEASMQENYDRDTVDSRHALNDEKLILSTVHQAKGLEWEAVFVINLASGQFPNDRALREDGGLEEERRLFYVAITRAKKYLYLTYPLAGGFGDSFAGPSMFIEEIDRKLISESGFSGREETVWGSTDDFSDLNDSAEGIKYEAVDDGQPFVLAPSKPRLGFLKDITDL